MRSFLLLFLIFSSTLCAKYKYELGICSIFKYDVEYLPEWIEFHQKQGVQKIWLYNNGGHGRLDYEFYLRPYIQSGFVTVKEWPYSYNSLEEWNEIQCDCYLKCLKRIQKKCKWCAVIDTDEFLFSPKGEKLPQVLNDYEKYAAVSINFVMYGTSNVLHIPQGEKMTDHLLYRSEIDHPANTHTNCIVRPSKVEKVLNPHEFVFTKGAYKIDENKRRFEGPWTEQVSVNILRLNHYWTRDLTYFHEKKIPIRESWGQDRETSLAWERDDLNTVFDDLIRKFN